jgi:AraC-like DNA-binding protein
LEPNEVTGDQNFKVYHFEGTLPNLADLLVPHRKNHYLFVFMRRAGSSRQWVDMTPYTLQANTFYFTGPENLIVKEELIPLWSTGIAFTPEFLSLQDISLSKLPVIENPQNGHVLSMTEADIVFVEDLIDKIRTEYQQPGEWHQRMLTAYLTVLLTYLSRLYTEQFKSSDASGDRLLLKKYQAKIDEHFQQLHEVGDYASMLNISAGHLSELIKNQSGRPAIKHIHDRLVLEARRLLLHTDTPLKDIAFNLGFSDTSYFNRFFKRETGATPAGYRSKIREMYH